MNKTDLKQILISVVAGVLSTFIAGLLLADNRSTSELEQLPRLMYVQHLEPAHTGGQGLGTV